MNLKEPANNFKNLILQLYKRNANRKKFKTFSFWFDCTSAQFFSFQKYLWSCNVERNAHGGWNKSIWNVPKCFLFWNMKRAHRHGSATCELHKKHPGVLQKLFKVVSIECLYGAFTGTPRQTSLVYIETADGWSWHIMKKHFLTSVSVSISQYQTRYNCGTLRLCDPRNHCVLTFSWRQQHVFQHIIRIQMTYATRSFSLSVAAVLW